MGNQRLWSALEERDALYAQARHDRRGRHAPRRARGHRRRRGRLHGRERRRDPAAGPRHPRRAARADDGASCRAARRCACCSRRRSSAIPRRCCSTSRPTTSTSTRSTGCEEFLDPLRRHAHRHLARPPLPERRLHAHRRHRLPDDHHLHRRLRRHGDGQDADPLAHRGRERAAREEDRAAERLHRALLAPARASSQVHVAPEGSRAAADDRAGAVEHPAPVHQVRDEPAVGQGRRSSSRASRKALRRHAGRLRTSARSSTAARRSCSSAATASARRRCSRRCWRMRRTCRRRRATSTRGTRALGPRSLDRLLPAGPHRRDREGPDGGRVAAPVRSRTRRGRTSTACSARCCSAARKA